MIDSKVLILEITSRGVIQEMILAALKDGYEGQKSSKSYTEKLKNKTAVFLCRVPWAIKELDSFTEQLSLLDKDAALDSKKVAQLLYILFSGLAPECSEPSRVSNALLAAREAIVGKALYEKTRGLFRNQYGKEYRPWNDIGHFSHLSGHQITQTIISKLYHACALDQRIVINVHEVMQELTQAKRPVDADFLQRDLKHFIALLDSFIVIDQKNSKKEKIYFPFIQPLIINKLLERLKTNYSLIREIVQEKAMIYIFDKLKGAKRLNRLLDIFNNHPYPAEIAHILGKGFVWAPELFEKKETISSLTDLAGAWRIKDLSELLKGFETRIEQSDTEITLEEKANFIRILLIATFENAAELAALHPINRAMPKADLPPLYYTQKRVFSR